MQAVAHSNREPRPDGLRTSRYGGREDDSPIAPALNCKRLFDKNKDFAF